MIGPSDMYGDLSSEDINEDFELEAENDVPKEINPIGRFERNELRSWEKDFERELARTSRDDFIVDIEEFDDPYIREVE